MMQSNVIDELKKELGHVMSALNGGGGAAAGGAGSVGIGTAAGRNKTSTVESPVAAAAAVSLSNNQSHSAFTASATLTPKTATTTSTSATAALMSHAMANSFKLIEENNRALFDHFAATTDALTVSSPDAKFVPKTTCSRSNSGALSPSATRFLPPPPSQSTLSISAKREREQR